MTNQLMIGSEAAGNNNCSLCVWSSISRTIEAQSAIVPVKNTTEYPILRARLAFSPQTVGSGVMISTQSDAMFGGVKLR